MSLYVLFVSPGIGPGDERAARSRYDAEDEQDDRHLDEARIREVARALSDEFDLAVTSEDPEQSQVSTSGIPLELESVGDEPGPDVSIDGAGVVVSVYRQDTETLTAKLVERGLKVARAASRLVGGGIYDPQDERVLAADEGSDFVRIATERLMRPGPTTGTPSAQFKRARLAMIILVLIPTVGLNVARAYLHGLALFVVVFGAMITAAFFLSGWVRRSTVEEPPPRDAPPADDRPITPR